ncbi:phage tail assembly chaperone [Pseudomonas sp. S 311-6]|uniref:phage tail assembly chaperone n=1 Tax=Pseudomonas TaxID=286 RepID=UPI002097E249|nr:MULTISPECIES: phage tail assembly chaperone [Pseudomonas]MCO7563921.1 phage tail assembly chaperone [Pseudomonas mosselii]MCO7615273.1 phage tail assembly chaperone [Pseudomonas guariconensis]MCO7636236.1 phage tail assembly chaperone [Pseudomonas sp. S 311-6]
MEIQIFASKSTRGFYEASAGASVPSDAVAISAELRAELLEGERSGNVIAWGEDGVPFLVVPPPPSLEDLAVIERRWRDEQLAATDGVVTRHRDERDIGGQTTLSSGQFSELLEYRQDLRNWPQADAFPAFIQGRPPAPGWLAELAQ